METVSGIMVLLHSGLLIGQRGWNGQPEGGFAGLGISPFECDPFLSLFGVDYRNCTEKSSGIRVSGGGEEFVGVGLLHELSQIHYSNSVGNVSDYPKIMGYKEISDSFLLLQILQQVYNLGLDRDVKGANRFVADNKIRSYCQGPGNRDTLSLTT